ncbi:hypothetical protein [Actinomadura sp. GC306]|uniref:hypothetical protein n=1 Tax=Actinomadura sp. GC306 TaxID=2530367 RepID=UPI001FB7349C|nr:hypothetical protein [Actinomadura sp. GC306]
MDIADVETTAGRLAAEFGIRPPKVTAGWVPRAMRLGVRAKIYGRRRMRLVIGPAAERLEPDELDGELAVAMATYRLRRGFLARLLPGYAAVVVLNHILVAVIAKAPGWVAQATVLAGLLTVLIVTYRNFVYRADRKVVDVLGAGPLLAVLEAERRHPSTWIYLWATPHADRRAERAGVLPRVAEHPEEHADLLDLPAVAVPATSAPEA